MDLPEIPYEKFQLDNGLTVIVHEDHKAPVVAVSIWYHVGSANEPMGKTGFAHLFEHLMFSGSEHHRHEYFEPFELAGATDQNGTTWFDRTNYFQTVPTTALDMTLWMESDRMGHLLGAIGQHELDTQRGVVKNEKRQNENQPYGRARDEMQRHAFPANHPYRHPTIGSMEDIDGASLDDVRQWFRTYYGAANVVLVLAGDITPAQAREKAVAYFGDIPAGPPVERPAPWVAPRTLSSRSVQRDQVPMVRIMREWNVPGLGHPDVPLLQIAARMLGGGSTSRLYQRLVHRDQLAAGVSMGLQELALASMFMLVVMVRPGVDPAVVEAAIAEEWEAFLRDGPDREELARVATSLRAEFVHGLEKVGGFSGKAPVLAQGQLYRNDPAAYLGDLARWRTATPQDVLMAAQRWISQGDHTLTIVPSPADVIEVADLPEGLPASPSKPAPSTSPAQAYATTASVIDRSNGVPSVDQFPDLSFPRVQRARLSNGIHVILAERNTIPVTQVQVHFDAGLAAEHGANSGAARMTLMMLDEGTPDLDSVEIGQLQQRLGAMIQPYNNRDGSGVHLSVLNSGLSVAIELLAEIVRHPLFREEDLDRLRAQSIAGIQSEIADPSQLAARLLPRLLYGEGHAYGIPASGTGSVNALRELTPSHLASFHRAWLRPELATVFVAGDTTLDTALPLLEAAFGNWSVEQPLSAKSLVGVSERSSSRVHLVHRPGTQAQIMAGRVVAPGITPNYHAMQLANAIFGGVFSSRLNMNLREDKRWTYGASSSIQDSIGPRTLMISTAVQVDKTAESMREIVAELSGYAGVRPPTEQELEKVKARSIRTLPGTYETTGAVLGTLLGNQQYDRPDDYAQTLKQRIAGTELVQVASAAREMFAPNGLTWVVVGDLAQIETPIRDLGIGEVVVVDAKEIE